MRVFLENGADENIPGHNDLPNREILEFAVGLTRTEVVRVLLQHGADVHANNGGALRCARRIALLPESHIPQSRRMRNDEVIELLLAHGAVDQAAPEVEAEEAEEAEDDGAGAAGAAAAAEGGDEGDLN